MGFRPVNEDAAANFREGGKPGEPDLFTPRLTLRQEESQSMKLTNLPDVLPVTGVIIPGLAPAIVQAPPPDFKVDLPNVASIEQEFIGRNLFKVKGKTPGVARIHAEGRALRISAPFVAELIVTVIDKLPQSDGSNVIAGFVEGLSKSVSPALLVTVTNKLTGAVSNPRDVGPVLPMPLSPMPISLPGASLVISFQIGYAKGLWAGLKDLVDFPSEKELRELAQTLSKVMGPFAGLNLPNGQLNPQVAKFIELLKTKGREIGRILGEEVGKEVTDEVAKKSAQELCEWAGRIAGRVAFEIILTIAMEVLGVAAARLAEWVAKLPAVVARLIPRLRQILGQAFESLRELIRGARAAEDAAEAARVARGGLEAAQVAESLIREYVDLSEGAATAAERELGKWLDRLAQQGQLGSDLGRVRGMPATKGPGGKPDYHLFSDKNALNVNVRADTGFLRGDAVIPDGAPTNPPRTDLTKYANNVISNGVTSKAKRQADIVIIELGQGDTALIPDSAVQAWTAADVRSITPSEEGLKRLIIVRNTGGMRRIISDLRIR
jgi:hypothetical protein